MGPPGQPGPPGPPGDSMGYDAASLAAILAHGGQNQKGPDPLGDEPVRLFGKEVTEQERRDLVIKAYENLKQSFERFKKPNGQKNSPAKTCRDLFVAYPEYASGEYWIDPNDGDTRDAILVYCNADTKESCVLPKPDRTPQISLEDNREHEVWLSEISNGMKITYKADSNQIGFLQLLSATGRQNITYHCKKTVAYYDITKRTYRKGIKLLAWNDAEITPKGNHRFRYDVLDDECRHRRSDWAKTTVSYQTDKSLRLPIVDIAIRDSGENDQMFWVEFGPVCFI